MPLFNPTFNGDSIFGAAVRMAHVANANAAQVSAFFGQGGQVAMFGGSRGRVFAVVGVFLASDIEGLNVAEGLFQSYADGFAYVLVDTRGRTWQQGSEAGPRPAPGGGWGLPYKAVFHGLV
jgi:hypothetical protein